MEWDPPFRFVDMQLTGPYKLWRHTHSFAAEGHGTHISDEVRYRLPFGIFGWIVHRIKVKNDVETIFAYRKEAVRRLFG